MLAKEYAKAAFEVVSDQDQFLSDYQEFLAGLSENEDYYKLMDCTSLTKDTKKEMISKLVSGDLLDVLKVLIDNNRFNIVSDLYKEFQNLVDDKNNVMRVNVTSSCELTSAEVGLIAKRLETRFGKKIIIATKIEKSLIKGIKLTYHDKLIDDTYLNDIIRMKNSLKEVN